METYLSDNSGNRVPPAVKCVDPVAASGILYRPLVSGDDYEQELVGGEIYTITFIAGAGKRMLASITGVTSVAANIEWVFMANTEYIFHMPMDKTTLYFEADDDQKYVYIRKLAN